MCCRQRDPPDLILDRVKMRVKMMALAVFLVAATETGAEDAAVPVEDLDAAESQSYGYGYGTKVQDKYSVATGRAQRVEVRMF